MKDSLRHMNLKERSEMSALLDMLDMRMNTEVIFFSTDIANFLE